MKKTFKPILFSTEMVQAILEERKTQTRRVVKDKDKPLYKTGDVLWVRETFTKAKNGFQYRANYSDNNQFMPKWKPSLFMPKEACRLFLEVANVGVEQLNDISESDAIKEGVDSKINFKSLWQRIYDKKEGETWFDNPFVWVVEFKVIDKPENFI